MKEILMKKQRLSLYSIPFVFFDSCLHLFIHSKLVAYHRPISDRAIIPFFVEFGYPQIQGFKNCLFSGESPFFYHFPEAGIDGFHSICGIHYLANGAAVVEQLSDMLPISIPHVHGTLILTPCLFETLEFGLCCFKLEAP